MSQNRLELASGSEKKGKDFPLFLNVRLWLRDLFIAGVLAAMIVLFFYQPVRVEGVSMLPRIEDQERIFVNKFIYKIKPIQHGDVIVFSSPMDSHRSFIKRVIGVPGDTVQIRQGKVYVNGRELKESYVPRQFETSENTAPVPVTPGHYYVLGDHRNSSNDSRAWGLVPRQNIYGKAALRYWPLEKFGGVH